VLIVLPRRPIVAAAQGVNHGPLVQLDRNQCHVDQLNDPDEPAARSWAHRTS